MPLRSEGPLLVASPLFEGAILPVCAVPRLADVSPPRLRLNGVCLRLLVGGAPPQLGAGLRPLPASGVLPAIAMADPAPPPAPSSPCPSVLWRPVEQSWMPGPVPYRAGHSETCHVDAPW